MSNQHRVYVIGDLHFGHRKLAELRGFSSAAEHDAELVRRWNDRVRKTDTVYVLGDVCFGPLDILGKLKGSKKLAIGNHDERSTKAYLEHFTRVHAHYQFGHRGFYALLSHIPVHTSQLERRWRVNVHGHLHDRTLADPRYLCVSAEHCDLTPVPLRDVLEDAYQKALNEQQ